jgi:hypothetical protein
MKALPILILSITLIGCISPTKSPEEDPTACAVIIAKTITDPGKDYFIYGVVDEMASSKSGYACELIEYGGLRGQFLHLTFAKFAKC